MKFVLMILVFLTYSAWSLVDTKSGNYKKTFVDFNLQGSAFPLTLERTYNSRSLYRGLFGMGWCSNIETQLSVLPDNSIKIVECGGGQEIIFLPPKVSQNLNLQVSKILQSVKKKNSDLDDKYMSQLKNQLMKSQVLRNEFLRAYNVKGRPSEQKIYLAEGRSNDLLKYNKKGWFRRVLPNGIQQFFSSSNGRLTQISDLSGNYIKIVWRKDQVQYMMDNTGRRIVFEKDRAGQISRVKGVGKVLASYLIEDNNLVRVRNQNGSYNFSYDELHNLTQIIYPVQGKNRPKESLTYDKKKDWVMSFTNQKKCKETYQYKTNSKNPNHYWTDVMKKCGRRVTNKSRYEFWNKKGAGGTLYLHRARQEVNGSIRDVSYHSTFKRVSSITQNNLRTKYNYYESGSNVGMLKGKSSKTQKTVFAKYNNKCRKPTRVILQALSKGKVSERQTIDIQYNAKSCLMYRVSRSDGRWVSLAHDEKGRIQRMEDQSGKVIMVAYNNIVNKPKKITHKGVGSIELVYDSKGASRLKKDNPLIIGQVLSVFNGLMQIISPVAQEFSV